MNAWDLCSWTAPSDSQQLVFVSKREESFFYSFLDQENTLGVCQISLSLIFQSVVKPFSFGFTDDYLPLYVAVFKEP